MDWKKKILVSAQLSERDFHFTDADGNSFSEKVWVRPMALPQVKAISAAAGDEEKMLAVQMEILASCICNKDGSPIFTTEEANSLTVDAYTALMSLLADVSYPKKGDDSGEA